MTKFYAWLVDLVNDRYPPYHWFATIPVGAMIVFILLGSVWMVGNVYRLW